MTKAIKRVINDGDLVTIWSGRIKLEGVIKLSLPKPKVISKKKLT